MKFQNPILKIVALLFLVILHSQCEKDYNPPGYNNCQRQRGNNQPPACWSDITDWTGLMPDSLFAIKLIPAIPSVDSNYKIWLNNKYNRIDIRSLTSDNYSDLQCLKQYLENRTLVQLGESSHYTKEYSQVKIRIIKFLHEQLGFDVIAFESGFFECFYTNENILNFSVTDAIKNSIFSIWGTPMIDLFTYIKATQSTSHPLTLAGFDCQYTSAYFSISKRPGLLFDLISKVDIRYANEVRNFDSLTTIKFKSSSFPYSTQYKDSIKAGYSRLNSFIDQHYDSLILFYPDNPVYPLILKQSVSSTLAFLDELLFYLYNDIFKYYAVRDSAMAANVVFLKEKLYPQKKTIIWAHNYHIAKSGYPHAVNPDSKVMGVYLAEKYGSELYTIGLYMLRGTTRDNNGNIIHVPLPVSSNSLEGILYQIRKKYFFVDLLHQSYSEGNKWMYNPVSAKSYGYANESMVLRNVYDGIIFLDSTSVALYGPQ
jgi:erythromycin esterase